MYQGNVNRYKQNKVMLSSPGEILLALYDGAIRFCRQARVAIEEKNPAEKGQKIGSVMAILTELSATLDHDRAPDLCENLARLYDYLIDRLQFASINLDTEALDEVTQHLERLRETWAEAIRVAAQEEAQQATEQPMKASGTV
ncbi:MAG: flagellar export chaperone FliS [Myxococcota bacterium]|nr:flagellar export chaperone FliS [Myxococcota bacterium]